MNESDTIALSVAIVSLAIYHAHTFAQTIWPKYYLMRPNQSFVKETVHWVEKHDNKSLVAPEVVCAVQTLRNTMYTAMFLGGSALQFAFFFTNNGSNTSGTSDSMQYRALILSALFFASFLCYASTMRNANHLAYMIEIYDIQEKELELERSNELLKESNPLSIINNRSSSIIGNDPHHPLSWTGNDPKKFVNAQEKMYMSMMLSYTLGFRFLFLSIPFIFYSAGYLALILATAFILIFLYNVDHTEDFTAPGLNF